MKRGLAALIGVSAALALGACGDDDTDDVTIPDLDEATLPDITGVETPDVSVDFTVPDVSVDFTVPDISMPDFSLPEDAEEAIRNAFPDLDEAQVDCLVESASGQDVSIDSIMDLADQCDIELQDLIPGG